jgi:hypothetical protein
MEQKPDYFDRPRSGWVEQSYVLRIFTECAAKVGENGKSAKQKLA